MFTHDYLYYWELPRDSRKLLGEVQFNKDGFNAAFTLDGTKDSMKVSVFSYSQASVIKPYSIVWHENTNTYWIVSNDRVERYTNETGYLYKHTLQLEGAIELLNARDLTDCGYYQNRYTIESFIRRLFALSTFEFADNEITINFGTYLNGSDNIDYIKSYENYTLLSAITDFVSGYNCGAKLSFTQNAQYNLSGATLTLLPKTGKTQSTYPTFDDAFNEIQQIDIQNKNSYGTTVVSNTQNVVSTVNKVYPSVGSVKLQTQGKYKLTPNASGAASACIRLPSNIFKINSVSMLSQEYAIRVCVKNENQAIVGTPKYIRQIDLYNLDKLKNEIETCLTYLRDFDNDYSNVFEQDIDNYEDYINDNFNDFVEEIRKNMTIKFYDGTIYDGVNNKFYNEKGVATFYDTNRNVQQWALVDKETRDSLNHQTRGMYYERGSNLIKGFDFFETHKIPGSNATIRSTKGIYDSFKSTKSLGGGVYASLCVEFGKYSSIYGLEDNLEFYLLTSTFIIDYIPMSDLKIKLDNSSLGGNVQLYNQNGKLNDCNSLSKLLNSYKTEIESENITKYAIGYDLSEMPQVGDIITKNNEFYVINNASFDFYLNEDEEDMCYYIVGEYSLSKNVATKSLMTSPNTNIRDYGIPQNYNVKRKQLYRDFYELDIKNDNNADINWYLPLSKVLNISTKRRDLINHIGVIKVGFANGDNYYYQLNSTTYLLKKSLYEVLDLQDNNIIGYGVLNRYTGFDITKVLTNGSYANIYTPISYVDDNGEVKDFTIAFCTNEQITSIWEDYKVSIGNTSKDTLYNATVLVPSELYEGNGFEGAKDNNDLIITALNYYKDAIEVPVFEYSFQIDNTNRVIVGENVLDDENSDFLMYGFVAVPKGTINEYNYGLLAIQDITGDDFPHTLSNSAKLEYISNNSISVSLYESSQIGEDLNTSYINKIPFGDVRFNWEIQDLVLIKYKVSPYVTYVSQQQKPVKGASVYGALSTTIVAGYHETLSDFAIEIETGYKMDTPQYSYSFTSDRVTYILGGTNYDDTVANGTLTVNIVKASQTINASIVVSGSTAQGTKTIELSGLYDPQSISIAPDSSSEGAYAVIISLVGDTLSYECGADDAYEVIRAIISYNYEIPATTRTIDLEVSGTRNQLQYYAPELDMDETIDGAILDNVYIINNKEINPYATINSVTQNNNQYIINYSIGCDIPPREIRANITYKSTKVTRNIKKDLLFVVRDMDEATISSDNLLIAINYYKTY